MPKVSKAGPKKVAQRSSPGEADILGRDPSKHYCTRCGRGYKSQKGNFPASQSPMFAANSGYVSVCRDCLDEMYRHYRAVLGGGEDDRLAIRRMCMKFDIYWHPDIYAMLDKVDSSKSRMLAYISKANLYQFKDRTFDDTLDEEAALAADQRVIVSAAMGGRDDEYSEVDDPTESPVSPELIEFWGTGLAPSLYLELQNRFDFWVRELNADKANMDAGTKSVLRQICNLEVQSNKDMAAGKNTDKLAGMINTLLGSANLKPVQKKEDEKDAALDKIPYGVWIRKIEEKHPIPEASPEFQDVDGIVKYISTWFFGHISHLLGLKNMSCKLYEDKIAEMKIERPELEEEDDEDVFNLVFGGEE